jgi:hypothetical protein
MPPPHHRERHSNHEREWQQDRLVGEVGQKGDDGQARSSPAENQFTACHASMHAGDPRRALPHAAAADMIALARRTRRSSRLCQGHGIRTNVKIEIKKNPQQ